MSRYFLGIDPGSTGALAMISESGNDLWVWDYPGSARDLYYLLCQIRGWSMFPDQGPPEIVSVVIEQVHSMPKQGVASTFKFGTNFGIWQGVIASTSLSYELITPQRWRKILDSSVPQKPTKEDLRSYVIRKYPMAATYLSRKKDHNRAEAILIADYARLKYLGEVK